MACCRFSYQKRSVSAKRKLPWLDLGGCKRGSVETAMLAKLKSVYKRLPSFSPRFHIAFGLSSLLTSVVLLSVFLGFVPDREGAVLEGRVSLAEAVSATSSVLLKQNNLSGMGGSLEFILDRNSDLQAIELQRSSDNSRVYFGVTENDVQTAAIAQGENAGESDGTSFFGGSIVSVPLLRGEEQWGQLHFQFAAPGTVSWFDKIRQSSLGLMLFIGFLSFPVFYFYLGKMLKELNPSNACLLYTSPSPRGLSTSRMPSSA